jgi:outer membrane protein assembly factor BamE (lipoprotein component of BamABCDE complex)
MRKRLAFALLSAAVMVAAQPGAVVTERMSITIDGRQQTARRINGRWWSPDNRELSRTNTSWLWSISGGNAREFVRFDHHYPVDPSKVSLLDRSMGPDQVRRILGEPNSVFPSDRPEQQQMWDYYGRNGYKLSIHFSSSGQGIFTASYEPDARSMPKDVDHLAFRFNGKTAQESFEESKQKRVQRQIPSSTAEWREQLRAEVAARRGGVPVEAAPVVAAPASRPVTAQVIQAVSIGMSRERLIELLGEPISRMGIAGGESSKETLRYRSESGTVLSIVLVEGKVSVGPH